VRALDVARPASVNPAVVPETTGGGAAPRGGRVRRTAAGRRSARSAG
jgi:hypothetical protein